MLILFDIDGTLLTSDHVGARAVQSAASELFGRELAHGSESLAGRIDPEIYLALCTRNGIPEPERHHGRFRTLYAEKLAALLAEGARVEALPGVRAAIAELCRIESVTLGILTGNYRETGSMKLAAVGLAPETFPCGAWGDDGAHRRELPPVAIRRCLELTGRRVAPADVVIVGDTPKDVDCARANGCRSLAVATGGHGVAELRSAGADHVVADLSSTPAVLELLGLRD